MKATTIKLTYEQQKGVEALVKGGIYSSKNEAIRDAVRELLEHKLYSKEEMLKAIDEDIKWGLGWKRRQEKRRKKQ